MQLCHRSAFRNGYCGCIQFLWNLFSLQPPRKYIKMMQFTNFSLYGAVHKMRAVILKSRTHSLFHTEKFSLCDCLFNFKSYHFLNDSKWHWCNSTVFCWLVLFVMFLFVGLQYIKLLIFGVPLVRYFNKNQNEFFIRKMCICIGEIGWDRPLWIIALVWFK